MKQNKIFNLILEYSQILLVFLGVFLSLECLIKPLSFTVNEGALAIVLMITSVLFYAFFTVLETLRRGKAKAYGFVGILVFFLLVLVTFFDIIKKGCITIVNTYLKEFMSYHQNTVNLLPTNGSGVNNEYCETFVFTLVGAIMIVLISMIFYRRRRAGIFIGLTALPVILPITVGKIGPFQYLLFYMLVAFISFGTRFLRADTIDTRMRQKLSFLLAGVGLIVWLILMVFFPMSTYENHKVRILELKNSALSLASWNLEDTHSLFKSFFSGDVLDYGKVGDRSSISESNKPMLRLRGDFNTEDGLYLKGYVASQYNNNRWRTIKSKNKEYKKDRKALDAEGLSPNYWPITMRNQIGEGQKSGFDDLWKTGIIDVQNITFGYGNYLVPYYPVSGFSHKAGRSTVTEPGIQYQLEYYLNYSRIQKQGFKDNTFSIGDDSYWAASEESRGKMETFVRKYYLQIPDSAQNAVEEYKAYLVTQDNILEKYEKGEASLYQLLEVTKKYISERTHYSTSPGKTPDHKEAIDYFLNENQKGYCVHYATAAAILLRGVGVPTRYCEGVYITQNQLKDVDAVGEVVVTAKDLHAWIEVFHNKYGFIPAEVTPGQGDDSSTGPKQTTTGVGGGGTGEGGEIAVTPTPQPGEEMKFENIQTESYDHEYPEEPDTPDFESGTDETGTAEQTTPGDGKQKGWGIVKAILLFLGVVILLLVLLEVQRVIRKKMFLRELHGKNHARKVKLCYRHLEQVFREDGVEYRGQTAAEYAHLLAKKYHVSESTAVSFVDHVLKANFSNMEWKESDYASFAADYRSIRKHAYEGVKKGKQLYYKYILVL